VHSIFVPAGTITEETSLNRKTAIAAPSRSLELKDTAMRTYQLLTYHLRTPDATRAYAQILVDHIRGHRLSGVATQAIFTSPSRHNAVIALVCHSGDTALEASTAEYVANVKLRAERVGFDFSQIIRADNILLDPFTSDSSIALPL